MLKGKHTNEVDACGLTSCRTRAETLARALNSRMCLCTWGSTGESNDVSNGEKTMEAEDEEFFDASPSPVEDEKYLGKDDSSAATDAGRAKLYQLLQHAADDVTDVFYDVSEHTESPGAICESRKENSKFNCSSKQNNLRNDNPADTKLLNKSSVCGTSNLSEKSVNGDEKTDLNKCSAINNGISNNTEICTENTLIEQNTESKLECDNSCELSNNFFQTEITNSKEDNKQLNNCHTEVEDEISNILENVSLSNEDMVDVDTCSYIKNNSLDFNKKFDELEINSSLNENNEQDENSDLDNIETTRNGDLGDVEIPNSLPIQILEEFSSPTKCEFDKNSDHRRLQVLNEDRPLISRSTSLKTGKTPPGTPGRKKIVRFADVLGLDLEDIRHIISGDLPTVPSSAFDDLELTEEEKPTSSTIELTERQSSAWENTHGAIGPNALYPTFLVPSQQPDFWSRVHSQGVCLDTVVISDFSVQCTCRVVNWGFNKKVLARYTFNSWISSNDIDASYVSGSNQNDTDSFTFNIFLPPSCKNVEFALRYEVNGKEFWDNNGGKNYGLRCHGNENVMSISVPSSPTWLHQFW